MKLESWARYLVAAVLVILMGAVWVLAAEETMKVEVRSEDGKELSIDVNGVTETITLDDLAEGEERAYDVGGHEVTIKRIDNRLTLVHDGLMAGALHGGHHQQIWVEGDGGHPIIIKRMGHPGAGDYVTYRCEETGSMLTVKADKNLLDDYIDPVTGCVMKEIEHAGVRVIEIQEKICEDEDE